MVIGEGTSVVFSIAFFLAFQESNDASTKLLCAYVFAVAIVLVHVFLFLGLFFTDGHGGVQQAPPQEPPEASSPKPVEMIDQWAPRYERIGRMEQI
jgi:hypothetical protein